MCERVREGHGSCGAGLGVQRVGWGGRFCAASGCPRHSWRVEIRRPVAPRRPLGKSAQAKIQPIRKFPVGGHEIDSVVIISSSFQTPSFARWIINVCVSLSLGRRWNWDTLCITVLGACWGAGGRSGTDVMGSFWVDRGARSSLIKRFAGQV